MHGEKGRMANIRKWIAEARDLEDSGDLSGALAIYRKALVAQEETSGFADLSLYNGLGDLFLRAGDVSEAVEAYENAAAQCEEQQLYANGIALCKKILRNAPDHLPVYRRVGRLFALSGLDAEASTNYQEYARRCRDGGRESEAFEALREMIAITADEAAAVELADTLAAGGSHDAALAMLRAARERRERQGRDFVTLLRKIQEFQPHATPTDNAPTPTRSTGSAEEAVVSAKTSRPVPSTRPSTVEAGQSHRVATPAAADTPTPTPGSDAPSMPSFDVADTGSLTRELQRVLSSFDGDERFRLALPIIEALLEIQPGRFELLHRKVAYAFALGDETAAVQAYLALGECLDAQFESFTLRALSTSTPSGSVTAAVKVERSPAAPESRGGSA